MKLEEIIDKTCIRKVEIKDKILTNNIDLYCRDYCNEEYMNRCIDYKPIEYENGKQI